MLLNHPHVVVELELNLVYCDGAHDPETPTAHIGAACGTVITVSPPHDDHEALAFPPVDDDGIRALLDHYVVKLIPLVGEAILTVPGAATQLELELPADPYP